MAKTIGLTYDLKSDWVKHDDDPPDAAAELDGLDTIKTLTRAFESAGHQVVRIGNARQLLVAIEKGLSVDMVFNIAEGYRGRNRESQVPNILEMFDIPFCGADALTLGITLDKAVTKKCWIADGVPTPKFFEATLWDDLKKLNTIGYPLMVKTSQEGTSKGITKNSRVEDLEQLQREVERISTFYKQAALCEQFIRGTEFTVAVIGNEEPIALAVVQYAMDGDTNIGNKFYTYEHVVNKSVQYLCPAPIEDGLTQKLQQIAVAAYKSVECRDFGRVDFRVDEKGRPFALEINPLPNLGMLEVFPMCAKARGITYNQLMNQILDHALERYGLLEPQEVLSRS
ncbi:MAG: ATP-grasp domain-containing protein [Candidatus Omnitrophica bacterium]|nr:ATP-grasp domain-containing protein [Candidatus Omnitrophota bacterium]